MGGDWDGRRTRAPEAGFAMERDLLCASDAEGRFTSLNAAWEEVLGWSREELMSRPFIEFVHPDDVERTAAAAARIADADYELAELENRYRTKDGGWRWLRWQARTDGSTWFAVAFDVTEAKAAEERLRAALVEERLLAYRQPIMDQQSGAIVQEELLVRLAVADGAGTDEGERVLIPGEFLPDAERLGLIGIVDRHMLGAGLARAARGNLTEINLSAQTIADPGLAAELVEAVREAGEVARLLVFEITETAVIENIDAARELAEQLVEYGCHFALDDFGTGYGSLTQLRELPVDLLKIDRSFVSGLTSSSRDRALVRSIVGIASEFGIRTVAEGVEDEATLAALGGVGTDLAQGYLIGTPQPLPAPGARFQPSGTAEAAAPRGLQA